MQSNLFVSDLHKSILAAIMPVLQSAGIPEPDMREIYVSEKLVMEFTSYCGLSTPILDHDMRKITSPTQLDHYTNMSGFKGIMSSQQLQLAQISRRLDESEMSAFALEHGLISYVDEKGIPLQGLTEAANDLFYISFTNPTPSPHLWATFGDNGNGYRLRFEVTPRAAELRAIHYASEPTVLKRLNDALVGKGLPRFVLKGVSRVGAFYLPPSYENEEEIRLLAKRYAGGNAPVVQNGDHEHWPIPIGTQNNTADITLIEIGVKRLSPEKVAEKLPTWCAKVPVVRDT